MDNLGFDGCTALRYDEKPKMYCCRLNLVWMLAGMTVGAGFMATQAQQAFPSGGRKIEFSDPAGSVATSNLNAIANLKGAFPSLENDLRRSFEVVQPGGSLQGVAAPPGQRTPASGANSKKLKEFLEKRQDWQFLEPEDYHSEQTIEEALGIPEYGPDGELKEKKSPLERYFERLERGNVGATNRTRSDDLSGVGFSSPKKNDGTSRDLNPAAAEKRADATADDNPLTQLLRGNTTNPSFPDATRPAGFSDVFGQSWQWKPESTETARAQAARLEEFKRIWDAHTSPTLPSASPISGIAPYDPLKSLPSTTPAFSLPRGTDTVPVVPATPVATFAPVRDSLGSLPTAAGTQPAGLPEVSTTLPGLTPSAPLPEPARTTVPAADFSIPKRRFP